MVLNCIARIVKAKSPSCVEPGWPTCRIPSPCVVVTLQRQISNRRKSDKQPHRRGALRLPILSLLSQQPTEKRLCPKGFSSSHQLRSYCVSVAWFRRRRTEPFLIMRKSQPTRSVDRFFPLIAKIGRAHV